MKVYRISSPEQLKALSSSVKWQFDNLKVLDLATAWSATIRRDPSTVIPFTVTMELGRSAILYKENNGEKKKLATLYLAGAREFAKKL